MHLDSVEAYDLPDRVRTYDADMDIMHPLRRKMIQIALEVIPFQPSRSLKALDLGIGTGVFAKRFLEDLEEYPYSRVVGVDGAGAMLELAKSRLGDLARRVEWVCSDFKSLPAAAIEPDTFDVVISTYALHHLNAQEKLVVLKSVVAAIKLGGWFLNADLVVAEAPEVERRIQEMRVAGVTDRAPARDGRFSSIDASKRFLDDLEAAEKDQPRTLNQDRRILRESGIAAPEVFLERISRGRHRRTEIQRHVTRRPAAYPRFRGNTRRTDC